MAAIVAYRIVKLPPILSMASRMPASSSACTAAGIWLHPPNVGTSSSHSSRP